MNNEINISLATKETEPKPLIIADGMPLKDLTKWLYKVGSYIDATERDKSRITDLKEDIGICEQGISAREAFIAESIEQAKREKIMPSSEPETLSELDKEILRRRLEKARGAGALNKIFDSVNQPTSKADAVDIRPFSEMTRKDSVTNCHDNSESLATPSGLRRMKTSEVRALVDNIVGALYLTERELNMKAIFLDDIYKAIKAIEAMGEFPTGC